MGSDIHPEMRIGVVVVVRVLNVPLLLHGGQIKTVVQAKPFLLRGSDLIFTHLLLIH